MSAMKEMIARRVYISGPVSGRPLEEALAAFNAAESKLRAAGWAAVNPVRLSNELLGGGKAWEDYMAYDLELLESCGAIAFLEGWQGSQGARLEAAVARRLGLEEVAL